MTVNDDLYGSVTQASLPKIIESYRKQEVTEEVPTEVTAGEPVHA